MFEYLRSDLILPCSQLPASIREADANAEQYLWEEGRKFAEALPIYWAYLTTKIGDNEKVTLDDFLKLQEPDRVFLAVNIYKRTFGSKIILVGDCPFCGTPANHQVDLDTIDCIPLPEGAVPPTPTFKITLPRTQHKVVFGFRTGHEENEESKIVGFNPTRNTYKAIKSIDDKTDFKYKDVLAWPLSDHKVLRDAIAKTQCGYDTRIRFTHAACGKSVVLNLLADPSFLMPGLSL